MDFDSMVQNMCDYEAVGVVCRDPLLNREFVFTPWTDVRSMPHREGLYAIAIEFLEAGGYCQKDIEKAIKKAKANRRKPRKFSGIL
ncbi:hypothetical protein CANMA_003689 [Candida margitis]|uniref:uncharacterized protein n=1 Tax=Candida margitis TaxID=1775924 RepID=UPI0022264E41|nr:uncharacterized protein CANMA_003689 [Candida margitis]KAI5961921.1 hypothetical protein CANMA_003689 [Candida margitis]